MTELNMMLPFPVHIDSINSKNNEPWINHSYTVSLQFQNTTISVDIQEDDPRYDLIKQHLIDQGEPNENRC